MHAELNLKQPQKTQHTPLERALHGQQQMLAYAEKLYKSAKKNNDFENVARAILLRETYQPKNLFVANDLTNSQTGELFSGHGVLVELSSSRLAGFSQKKLARNHRRYMRTVLNNYPSENKIYKFITFTLPVIRGSFETVREIAVDAMTRFKKSRPIKRALHGAFFSEELTVGTETTAVQTHYHIHFHALALVDKFENKLFERNFETTIRHKWTDSVESACINAESEFLMPSSRLAYNTLEVDFEDVQNYANERGMALESAVNELCKYVVKTDIFHSVPESEIVEIENGLRYKQMYHSFGAFGKKRFYERFPELKTEKNSSSAISLDTTETIDAPRPTLTNTGTELIKQDREREFVEIVQMKIERGREFRAEHLFYHHQHAEFQTLANEKWSGVKNKSESNVKLFIQPLQRPKERILIDVIEQTDNRNLLWQVLEKKERANERLLNDIIHNYEQPILNDVIERTESKRTLQRVLNKNSLEAIKKPRQKPRKHFTLSA